MDLSTEELTVLPLGGGQEVGRSCILLEYSQRSILLDCGCHPGKSGEDSLPFFDTIEDISTINLVLITHFHIDHCAALPYLTEKMNFKGKIYMTHATKAVMKLLLFDNIRLQSKGPGLYNEIDLQNCMEKIEVLDFHQTIEYKGIKFTATPAGHVLGAAMFTIDIDNVRILYTGDYSLEEDRHLSSAEIPPGKQPNVLIVESTFGTTTVPPREQREELFTSAVSSIVSRGGTCLIPVFALGRAQELLLILDNYWADHPELHSIPIYYASKLATRSLKVYQTFINMMNNKIKQKYQQFYNPFFFKHIQNIQNFSSSSSISSNPSSSLTSSSFYGDNSTFEFYSPSVIMASPGFLQNGISRNIFELICEDERNGVIIAGYTIEGTLANDLLSLPSEIKCLDNRIKARRCQVEYISFSAHVDYNDNKMFIKKILPDHIILVHGEKTHMRRLKEALDIEIRTKWPIDYKPSVATPENTRRVRVPFRKQVKATVLGEAANFLVKELEQNKLKRKLTREEEIKLKEDEENKLKELEENNDKDATINNLQLELEKDLKELKQDEKRKKQEQEEVIILPSNSLLITENFNSKIVTVNELTQHTNCKLTNILERFLIPIPNDILLLFHHYTLHSLTSSDPSTNKSNDLKVGEFDENLCYELLLLLLDHLLQVYEKVKIVNSTTILIQDTITISINFAEASSSPSILYPSTSVNSLFPPEPIWYNKKLNQKHSYLLKNLYLTWYASPLTDILADSILSLLMNFFSAPHLIKRILKQKDLENNKKEKKSIHPLKEDYTLVTNGYYNNNFNKEIIKKDQENNQILETKEEEKVEISEEKVENKDENLDIPIEMNKIYIEEDINNLINQMKNKQYTPYQLINLSSSYYSPRIHLINLEKLLNNKILTLENYKKNFKIDDKNDKIDEKNDNILFTSINLNKNSTLIVFKGLYNTKYSLNNNQISKKILSSSSPDTSLSFYCEAFCFIVKEDNDNNNNNNYHAVIESNDNNFKDIVSYILQNIDNI